MVQAAAIGAAVAASVLALVQSSTQCNAFVNPPQGELDDGVVETRVCIYCARSFAFSFVKNLKTYRRMYTSGPA